MKHVFIVLILLISVTGCKKAKQERNVSIMRNKQSIINSWYGKDHFKPGIISSDEPLNKNSGETTKESDAGTFNPNPQPTSGSSSESTTPSSSQNPAPANSPMNAIDQTAELLPDDSKQLNMLPQEAIVKVIEVDIDLD